MEVFPLCGCKSRPRHYRPHMKLKTIYEDGNVLVVDKPAGMDILAVIKLLPSGYNPAHRLDKDTSGIFLVAKNNEALNFLQKQFKQREVEKKYLALVVGELKPKRREIKTLIGRDPKDRKKQKAELPFSPGAQREGLREAITEYSVLKKFKEYCLIEVAPKTGRKHQIRVHLAYLGHPIAGDKIYGFKNQPCPENLKRQFLHAHYLKIQLPDGEIKEFKSELPDDLKKIKI